MNISKILEIKLTPGLMNIFFNKKVEAFKNVQLQNLKDQITLNILDI